MTQLKITQIKSAIGRQDNQHHTLRSLGLKRIGGSVVREDTDVVRGYIKTVSHLVTVETVPDEKGK
jgi:large subunit ribosomal protein L30